MNQSLKTCDCKDCELKSLFFNNIDDDEISLICDSKNERSYQKGETICKEGTKINEFIYLKSGLVKLFKKDENNKDHIIKIAGPFTFVSMLSVFSASTYQYSVTALEESVVCYIDLKLVKQLVLTNGKFALNLLERMSYTSDDIIQTSLEINKKNLRGRIAYVLLYFSKIIYKNETFDLPVSRKEIAEYIEMTTENVIRILSEFRKDGIIKIYGKTIEIVNSKLLQKICELG